MSLRTVVATRYATPLREAGSLPAIEEADDGGLRVPQIVFVDLDPDLARSEPDPEIQELIRASAGSGRCDDPHALLEHVLDTMVRPPPCAA